MSNYSITWNLDSIFPGGSESQELRTYAEQTNEKIAELEAVVKEFLPPKNITQTESMEEAITLIQECMKRIREFGAFVSCLHAQDVKDQKAGEWQSIRRSMRARLENCLVEFDQKLVQVDDQVWNPLIHQPPFKELSFILDERRNKAMDLLEMRQERLMNDLAVDGYHAWGQMYDKLVGNMTVTLNDEVLSVGQAANRMGSSDRSIRKRVFDLLQESWTSQLDLFGETLNHLAGFRLQMYRHRKWDDTLQEPLSYNRMSKKTLTAMWAAISDYKEKYNAYFKRKAELLGVEKLSIYDVEAPIGDADSQLSFDEGASFILKHFASFSPKMADFAKMAFEKGWIEAEDRPGKRPGGFCTSLPDSEETRIFMTYSGTASNVATLAHELGHAYHQHVMNNLPILNQGYAMNVAETASTLAEMIVADAAVEQAVTKEDKLALLEEKVQRSIAFFMNIHARFLFETRFYEEREKGTVPVERLNELMIEAQQEAYQDSLDEYDPTFWASKLHFHITDVPFYNFPYTFGYLFSLGVYAKAKESGEDFEDQYIALLQDTGMMKVEELAKKHLQVDLESKDFWYQALDVCVQDLDEFLELSKQER